MVSPSPLLRPRRRQSDPHAHGMWRVKQWSKPLCSFLSLCGLLVHNGSSQRHPLPTTSDASKSQPGSETIIHHKEPTSSPLPSYRQLPRIAIQHDAPRPNWSCGTIAMCTTLHLLLGNSRPHALPTMHISRDYMHSLHKALLAWLLTGTPPTLWEIGYLHRDIISPPTAHVGPYAQLSVAAAIESPKGEHWRPIHPTKIPVEAPNMAALTMQHTGTQTSQGNATPHLRDPHQHLYKIHPPSHSRQY